MPKKVKMINFKSEGSMEKPPPAPTPTPVPTGPPPHKCTPNCVKAVPPQKPRKFRLEDLPRDTRNRRIITKESLLEDLSLIVLDEEPPSRPPSEPPAPPVAPPVAPAPVIVSPPMPKRPKKPNKLEKELCQVLSQPVKISIAESMMQKMGWSGGALGKAEDGILEPIAPNLAYALNSKGFGQEEPPAVIVNQRPNKNKATQRMTQPTNKQKPQRKVRAVCPLRLELKKKKGYQKKQFRVNVLKCILDFVRNENELEILFDCELHNGQRQQIHGIVEEIRTTSNLYDVPSLKTGDFALSKEIIEVFRCNRYVLMTQSEGEYPLRYLCLFKQAPEFMYLVTHLDFRDMAKIVHIPYVKKKKGPKGRKMRKKLMKNANNLTKADFFINKKETARLDPDVIQVDDSPEKVTKITDNTNKNGKIITNNKKLTKNNIEANNSAASFKKIDCDSKMSDEKDGDVTINIDDTSSEDEPYDEYEFDEKFSTDDEEDSSIKIDNLETNGNNEDVAKISDNVQKVAIDTTESLVAITDEAIIIESEDEEKSEANSILDMNKLYSKYTDRKNAIRKKVHECFADFLKGDVYTEFKFLGDFENDELEVKNEFIKKIWLYLNEEPVVDEDLSKILSDVKSKLSLEEDCNGATVVIKTNKEDTAEVTN